MVGFGGMDAQQPHSGTTADSFDVMKTKTYTMELGSLANNLIRDIKEKDEVIDRLKKEVERLKAMVGTAAVARRMMMTQQGDDDR